MRRFLTELLDDQDDPDAPVYDPVHFGAALLLTLTVLGALYWLLWTLLVFEGGLAAKVSAAAAVLFTEKTASDFGYEAAPYAMGVFTGWFGNVAALLLAVALIALLYRAYRDAQAATP